MKSINPFSRWQKCGRPSGRSRLTTAVKKLKETGEEFIDLRPGDPGLYFTNPSLSNILVRAAKDERWNRYPKSTNFQNRCKEAIAHFEKKERGVNCSSEDIIITNGAAAALNVLHFGLLDDGDLVSAFDPSHYFTGPVSYFPYLGAKALPCRSIEAKNWEPDIDDLRAKVSDKTKAIFVNNPNNPTGAVYSEKTLKKILDFAGENNVLVISDEIYGLIAFDGIHPKSIATIANDVPVIVLSGMSKFFIVPGWRVGYMCFHDPLGRIVKIVDTIKKVAGLYGFQDKSIPTPILAAAAEAFEGDFDDGKRIVRQLQINRDSLLKRINGISGLSCSKPMGALYAFPRVHEIGETWETDDDFLVQLLEEERVAFKPGSLYGKLGYGHFRTTLLPKREIFSDVCDKLERFMTRHSAEK